MTPQELQELIAQQYGNVLTAGQALTSNAAPVPQMTTVAPSSAIGQATNLASNVSKSIDEKSLSIKASSFNDFSAKKLLFSEPSPVYLIVSSNALVSKEMSKS